MPANVQTYIGRQAAWHNLGKVTGQYFSWADIEANGGLDFEVFKSQLHDGLGRPVGAWGVFRWDKADFKAGAKEKAIFLGAVGEDYKPIPHNKGFRLIDGLMSTETGAHYETAGVLGKGEVVWGLADLKLAMRVGDDVQVGYLLFYTSHDGSRSFGFRLVMERVVCQNTLDAAMSEKTRASLIIRHTKNADDRILDAQKVLENMGSDVKKVEDKLNFLAGRKMNREAMNTIMDRLFPKTEKERGDGIMVEVSSTRRDNILGDILKIYELNDGNAFPEQRGTAYNMLNAITNYVDHERSSSSNGKGRAESALFGSGQVLKQKAMEIIMESAGKSMETIYVPTVSLPPSGGGGLLDSILTDHH